MESTCILFQKEIFNVTVLPETHPLYKQNDLILLMVLLLFLYISLKNK